MNSELEEFFGALITVSFEKNSIKKDVFVCRGKQGGSKIYVQYSYSCGF